MEQSRGDEESAEIGAACAAVVRGSRFADLGSRPRNVTEHAAAIEDREPQPQPVCGRGMSRGPGPAEADLRPVAHTARRRTLPRRKPGASEAGWVHSRDARRHAVCADGGRRSGLRRAGRPSHVSHTLCAPQSRCLRSHSRGPPPRRRHRTRVAPGYGKLSEQLRRALLGAYLQFTEGAARDGADRNSRLRCARAEAGESAPPSRPPSFSASPPRRGSGPSLSCSIASAPWSPGSAGSAPAALGVAAARSGARSRKRV